jgi:ribosomal protein L32
MAVPKKRTSHSKNRMRHSGKALKTLHITFDKNGDPQLPHFASASGMYKDRMVVSIKKKKEQEEANA